ncbi:MAG: ATP phosphoribosyltransferase [Oscillospiraceae bacterium]|jgi:ATP phosphoribosyltransferase|nr:ATP phosphoribosyltransferase [Oscillospiraceae bacterium]
MEMINIALPKGRLGDTVYDIFERADYGCAELRDPGRRLVFENPAAGVRYFWVKPSDVAIYVERGAADIGVAGSDILLEHSPEVYELLDLGVGLCRLVVAAQAGFTDTRRGELRVATKFTKLAQEHYDRQNREIGIIHLQGSIELAPLLGLSDVIVDLVATGNTLRENGLVVVEEVAEISARLIAGKVSYKFKHEEITQMMERIRNAL